ncbi:MAG: GGDEF domain-containing protein [Brevinematia bacterium]
MDNAPINNKVRYKTLFRKLDRSIKIVNEFSEFLRLLDLREVEILKVMMVRFMIETLDVDVGGLIEIVNDEYRLTEVFIYRGHRIFGKNLPGGKPIIKRDSDEFRMIETTIKREMPMIFEGEDIKNVIVTNIVKVDPSSLLIVPVVVNDKVEYVVELLKKNKKSKFFSFSKEDISNITIISNIASAIFTNAELFNRAIHDNLTGLYNINYFKNLMKDEMAKVKKFGNNFSLAVIDLDHFKHINDTYGHTIGDEALKFFAKVLKEEIRRSTDIVARYGGDEFIIAFPSTSLEGAFNVCSKIKERLNNENFHINNKIFFKLTPSIGIACITKDDINTKENEDFLFRKLFIRADTALYNSKKTGRNKITLYNESLTLIEEREI